MGVKRGIQPPVEGAQKPTRPLFNPKIAIQRRIPYRHVRRGRAGFGHELTRALRFALPINVEIQLSIERTPALLVAHEWCVTPAAAGPRIKSVIPDVRSVNLVPCKLAD